MDKKGQSAGLIGFLLLGVVVVFTLYIVAVPLLKVWGDASDELLKPEAFGSDNQTVEVLESYDGFITPAFDQIITIAFMGVLLTLMVISVFFSDHPIFIAFLFVGFIVVVIVASQLVNVADTAVRDDSLNGTIDSLTFAPLIFGNKLPLIIAVVAVVSIIIMITRSRGVTA